MEKHLFRMTGARSARVKVRPSLGLDFGVISLGRAKHLIVSSDPITGVSKRAGWYAVNVSANDVATSGNRPEFMQSVILLPENAKEADVAELSSEMDKTAKGLGIEIVGGHTELTPGLDRPIVMTTAFALASSYVTAGGAREGDTLMITKTAGVEGTAILATDRRVSSKFDKKTFSAAAKFAERLSLVEEAVGAYKTGFVHAMHDSTEGGVIGALYEIAAASGLGLKVEEGDIPVARETKRVCSALGVDPLKLISSGTLLVAVEEGREDQVRAAVEAAGSTATPIGVFTGDGVKLTGRGKVRRVTGPPTDEIWRLQRTRRG